MSYPTVVTPEEAGWTYSGLRIVTLEAGARVSLLTGAAETLVLPLAGSAVVTVREVVAEAPDATVDATVDAAEEAAAATGATTEFRLRGRSSVFARVTDFAYVPRDARFELFSSGGGRFALPSARCSRRLPARYGPAERVPVELRGAGRASRQVNNFCTPDAFECDKLIACEVLTPGGNWSSYPPHKHDEERPGHESALEEIYYFEVAGGPSGPGMGYQRVYGTADRPIDVLDEVRTGSVVLIPYGWHGPSMAVPGYDLYYLNVMAGPSPERAWVICDDPAHAWIRETWSGEPVDPRLPLTGLEEGQSR